MLSRPGPGLPRIQYVKQTITANLFPSNSLYANPPRFGKKCRGASQIGFRCRAIDEPWTVAVIDTLFGIEAVLQKLGDFAVEWQAVVDQFEDFGSRARM